MNNSYQRFAKRMQAHKQAELKANQSFIIKGYPSVEISSADGNTKVIAAVNNQQEKEKAYVYTALESPLAIGSMWTAKNLHLLITEEITVIKDVNWHKYHCFLCNLEVDDFWCYWIGPEKKHIDLDLKSNVLFSQQKPVLVMPGAPMNVGDKIMIKGRAWVVDEYDSISTNGITYYSLLASTMSKEVIAQHEDQECFIEHAHKVDVVVDDDTSDNIVSAGMKVKVPSEGAFFRANLRLDFVRLENAIEFTVPFGISEFEYKTKVNGEIVTTKCQVKEL